MVSLIGNLGLLFFFKYFNFFNQALKNVFSYFQISYHIPVADILLPVGISFYTFQSLSYTLDVFWKKRKAERHLGMFALYVSFFPQLVAGPIERSVHLLPQLFKIQIVDWRRIKAGLRLILFGFFQKVVIADTIAVMVEKIYSSPEAYSGGTLLLATYFFAFQIYYDFSGYSDIAIGSSKIFGIDLMKNFNQPYLSSSIREFWGRWHISLSSWFRDYLYIPLGGNKVPYSRWVLNIVVVFGLSGFWHGAQWTFFIWGLLHAFYYVVNVAYHKIFGQRWSENVRNPFFLFLGKTGATLMTFHCVCLAWIFFRAESSQEAFQIVYKIFHSNWHEIYLVSVSAKFGFFVIAATEFCHGMARALSARNVHWNDMPMILRWGAYYVMLFAVLIFINFESKNFIYFQF